MTQCVLSWEPSGLLSVPQSSHYSDKLHDFSVTISKCYKDVQSTNSLLPQIISFHVCFLSYPFSFSCDFIFFQWLFSLLWSEPHIKKKDLTQDKYIFSGWTNQFIGRKGQGERNHRNNSITYFYILCLVFELGKEHRSYINMSLKQMSNVKSICIFYFFICNLFTYLIDL